MAARSKARKRAHDILYEADIRGTDPLEVYTDQVRRRQAACDPPLNEYVGQLVEGVTRHRERIDELLGTYATGWTLDRMPAVDRSILRIGTFEVLYNDAVPAPVAIAEAVALAQDLSTDDSSSFVNGLLARLAELKPRLVE